MPEPAHDALDALRARLEETRLHAERLAEEAAAIRRAAAADDGTQAQADPERGFFTGDDGAASPPGAAPALDLQAIAALLETLRDLVPPELQHQLADVTRQVLLLLRALIDWWVDRLAEPAAGTPGGPGPYGAGGPPAQDIPVR